MRYMHLALFITIFYPGLVTAESIPCSVSPPIDTSEKAWCAIDKILLIQSCASPYGFERDTKDLGDRWLLIVKDKNPNTETSCRMTKLAVCKSNGTILYEAENKDCGT
jgi:hypothetical protein